MRFCCFSLSHVDTDKAPFPMQLTEVGLDEETLEAAIVLQCDWHIKDVPNLVP